jgi:hypothetical protein
MFGVVVSRMAKVFEPDVAAGGADPERAAVDAANTTPENAAASFRNQHQVAASRHPARRRGATAPTARPLARGPDL